MSSKQSLHVFQGLGRTLIPLLCNLFGGGLWFRWDSRLFGGLVLGDNIFNIASKCIIVVFEDLQELLVGLRFCGKGVLFM